MDIPVANFEVSGVFILRIQVVWVVSMRNRVTAYRRFGETQVINNTVTHRNRLYILCTVHRDTLLVYVRKTAKIHTFC